MILVSVIVPTFNRPRYLREAAASILGQTVEDLELLIVDDCSTDETPTVIDELCREDGRVVGLRTESNGGCNRARNLALDRAKGRFIALLDDDDLALPGRFASSLAALASQPAAGFASCGYGFIDARGARLPGSAPAFDAGVEAGSDRLFEALYCDWAWLPTCTLMFRSSALERHRYPDIRRSDGDSIFLSQLVARGLTFARVAETGTLIRRDVSYPTMSRDKGQLLAARRATLEFLRTWLREEGITRFDHLHGKALAIHLIREANHLGGFRGLAKALEALVRDPRNEAARRYLEKRIGR